ncbi:MAG: phosphatidate cytidylyltransferase [Carnobacterium sp.]|uniref:Phosphatidate cytidylyltransferase n=1 Tax=Carnobacterium antarcticum TaxID=2126436 RepID=A0ABW4NJV6_9LACT|nr:MULTISPECIES: phosphatidate cytidylyltransferase [unclassified Carnobacterium]ALV21151.1 Phosphatidate cytidylyltransferase [Carnobacterium sp. CP1]QQP71289.1 phosphatidate cytidylyltransferase [Carnobacterium sp. CS13]
MKQRVITAVLALIVFVPIVYLGAWPLEIVVALLGLIGLYELIRMKGHTIFSIQGLVASIALLLILLPVERWSMLTSIYSIETWFYICGLILMVATVFSKNHFTFDDAAVAILGSIYIGYGFKYFLLIRSEGLPLLLLALFIVWATDIGAYLFGRQFGKHKLAPSISPNKTIEGSVGGIVSAIVVAGLFFMIYPLDFSLGWCMLLAAVISVAGQLGDLVESAFKRHYQVKDSGKLLPGHGGILDRFDSILFALPVLHLLTLI